MPLYSVQTLINRAAALADVHDNFVTPQTWLDWFNAERKALILFRARTGWCEGIIDSSNITGGSVSLAIEPWAFVGVWEISTSGRYRRLTRIDPVAARAMRGITDTAQYWSFERDTDVDAAMTVSVHPTPSSGTYVVHMLDQPTQAATLADSFPLDLVDDERIVLGMARRALIKEESDTRAVDIEIARFEALVEETAWSKSLAEVPSVRNVDSETRGWESRIILPPFASWYWV